jgi:NhaP-type Na+/H+ or K+/H+ antiporter
LDGRGWETVLALAALFAILVVPVLTGAAQWFERTIRFNWNWLVHILVGLGIGYLIAWHSLSLRPGTETAATEADGSEIRTGSVKATGSRK